MPAPCNWSARCWHCWWESLPPYSITRQITGPLRDTLAVVDRIASGDLSQDVQVTRRDELGVLQQGIARMGVTLRDLISGIRDGVTQIASAAEELSAVTEQTSAGVNSQKIENRSGRHRDARDDRHRAGSRAQCRASLASGRGGGR